MTGGTPMPLFARVSPRGSRAASWSIPHVLGLPQHDFRCSFRPIWAVWDHRWECVGGRPSRRLSALLFSRPCNRFRSFFEDLFRPLPGRGWGDVIQICPLRRSGGPCSRCMPISVSKIAHRPFKSMPRTPFKRTQQELSNESTYKSIQRVIAKIQRFEVELVDR
eukprot:scaffold1332_cov319-Pavlova_lutheri.AAC.1